MRSWVVVNEVRFEVGHGVAGAGTGQKGWMAMFTQSRPSTALSGLSRRPKEFVLVAARVYGFASLWWAGAARATEARVMRAVKEGFIFVVVVCG